MPTSVDVTTPSDREIVITRAFVAAPRTLIWDCHTQPELIKRWMLGPPGWTMVVCEVDLQVGGAYHFRWRNAEGFEFGSQGEHVEIVPPENLVTTERMEGFDGDSVNTMTLITRGDDALLTVTMRFATKEARDGALRSGMAEGMAQSYDRIEQLADEQAVG